MESIVFALLFVNMIQGAFFFWQLHKLVNKVMSKDFAEYKRVESADSSVTKRQVNVNYEDEDSPPPNDLGF